MIVVDCVCGRTAFLTEPKTAEKFIGMTGHCPSCGKELEIVWQVQASLTSTEASTVKVTR